MTDQGPSSSLGELLLERFCRKNPLAASVRLVLERLFEPAAINHLFETNRDQQYTRQILFVTVVEVMLAVVTRKVASVHVALVQRAGALGASITAFYNKLNGTEPQVAEALTRHTYQRGRDLVAAMGGLLSEPLPGWRLRILDGNHLASTQRRLQVLWSVAAGPLPGLALVVFDVAAAMMAEVLACEDGHAQERSLSDRILDLVAAGDCWVADRNFCTTPLLFGFAKRDAAFVIRHHANLPFKACEPRHARGRGPTGKLFEQTGTIAHEDGRTLTLRRITVELDTPTRDDEPEIHVLTNLPSSAASAALGAELYLGRWTIETAFADLSRWLQAELAPLGYPRAALLGFCVGLMAYNALATVLGALRATYGEQVVREQVSGYYLAEFGREAVGGIDDVTEPSDWQRWQSLSLEYAARLLKEMAARIDLRKIRKAKRGPKKPVPPRTRFKGTPHVSTQKLLDGRSTDDDP